MSFWNKSAYVPLKKDRGLFGILGTYDRAS